MIDARGVFVAACCSVALALPGEVLADGLVAGQGQAAEAAIRLAVLNGSADRASAECAVLLGELAEALEAVDGLTVLDRDAIEKVLTEHRLSAMGVVKRPVEHGRMLGAGYLLYTEMPRLPSARTLAMLCVEVSSGNVIWERGLDLDALTGPEAVSRVIARLARDAFAAIAANEQRLDRPTATVLAVANRSRSSRLDFLAGSLTRLLEDLLAARGHRVLRRHNPGLLLKETTLGVSGMVRPDAAVLAEASELVVTASFTERPSNDVAFQRTPIKLTLGLRHRGKSARERTFSFTLAGLAKLGGKLRSALPAAGAATGVTTAPADKEVSRRLEAARLMAELKDLSYGASLAHHRRQIELARRVVYLDPSAKEAYYRLGISLDALTRRTWKRGGTHEGSSRDTADALAAYLRFPRTNFDHAIRAFGYLATHTEVLNKTSPKKSLLLEVECYRWLHQRDPVNRPARTTGWPQYYFGKKWWAENPREWVKLYTWVDELYRDKKHLSLYPFQLAVAYDQLEEYDKAAEYLYDGLVNQRLEYWRLKSVHGLRRWAARGRPLKLARRLDLERSARLLARRLDPERSARLLARLEALTTDNRGTMMAALYGTAYGKAKDLYGYRHRADEERIAQLNTPVAQPEVVSGVGPFLQSVIVRRTRAGLWMQGGYESGTMGLFFSEDGQSWRAVRTPEAMTKVLVPGSVAESANHVISIVQLGEEVLFATPRAGVFVHDRGRRSWKHYGPKEGLPSGIVARMTVSADGRSAWIAGGRFLCRYQGGKIFLPKAEIDWYPKGMVARGNRLLMTRGEDLNEHLLAVDPASGGKQQLLTVPQQRKLLPAPPMFRGAFRGYNAGVFTWQRLSVVGEKVYFAGIHGLAELAGDGKTVRMWRPDTFYHWRHLGGWVLGNCPLPPCSLPEVIADDRAPHRLWLVSKLDDIIPPYTFGYAAYPKSLWGHILSSDAGRSTCFITAFDTKTNLFSKPVRTKTSFTHAQPFGDHIYLTGRKFTRLPKKLWVIDQPGSGADQPFRVECPDTPAGRASRALLLGQRDQAIQHLRQALQAPAAPAAIGKMLKELSTQDR